MADVVLEAEDRYLGEELRRLKDRLESEGYDVDLWYPVRKRTGLAEAGIWLLQIVLAAAINDAVYPKIKKFLADWFTETPIDEVRPLEVEVRREGEDDAFDRFSLE